MAKGRALARPSERSERFEPVVSWRFYYGGSKDKRGQ